MFRLSRHLLVGFYAMDANTCQGLVKSAPKFQNITGMQVGICCCCCCAAPWLYTLRVLLLVHLVAPTITNGLLEGCRRWTHNTCRPVASGPCLMG